MNNSVLVDSRLKRKIESLTEYNNCYSVKFKDLVDTFFFNNKNEVQEFLNTQAVERYYDKTLRNGFFDYTNEYNEVWRFIVKSNRGTLTLIEEKFQY